MGLGPSAVQPAVSNARAPNASQRKLFARPNLLTAIVRAESIKNRTPTGVCRTVGEIDIVKMH